MPDQPNKSSWPEGNGVLLSVLALMALALVVILAVGFFWFDIRPERIAFHYHYNRGYAWLEQKKHDKAMIEFSYAINSDRNSAAAYYGRGYARSAMKDSWRAIADFSEAIRLDPTYAPAYDSRGYQWVAKREYDKAIADYTEAIRLDPKNAHYYYNRGYAWSDHEGVRQGHRRLLRGHPPRSQVRPRRLSAAGMTWFAKREYDKAIADYTEAIRPRSQERHYYNSRGCAWISMKQYDKAIADYTEAIRLDPTDTLYFYSRGYAWSAMKEYDKAIADFSEAIRLDSKDPWPYAKRAWLWATCPDEKYRDGKRAVESATRASELTVWKHALPLGTLAASYAESGDFAKAIEWQEKANKLHTNADDKQKGEELLKLYREKKPFREAESRGKSAARHRKCERTGILARSRSSRVDRLTRENHSSYRATRCPYFSRLLARGDKTLQATRLRLDLKDRELLDFYLALGKAFTLQGQANAKRVVNSVTKATTAIPKGSRSARDGTTTAPASSPRP